MPTPDMSNPHASANRKYKVWPEWAILHIQTYYQQRGDSELAENLTADSRDAYRYDAKQVEKKREKLQLKRSADELHQIVLRNKQAGRYRRRPGFQHWGTIPEGETTIWKEKTSNGSTRRTLRIKIGGELVSKSTHTWEQAYGPVPEGHIVAFRDGDPLNCDLDNLLVMSQADNIARNRNLKKGQQRQRQAQQTRHEQQRAHYRDLQQQLQTVEGRIENLKGGERDESYTVTLLEDVLKELNQRRNQLLLEIFKLPESVKAE